MIERPVRVCDCRVDGKPYGLDEAPEIEDATGRRVAAACVYAEDAQEIAAALNRLPAAEAEVATLRARLEALAERLERAVEARRRRCLGDGMRGQIARELRAALSAGAGAPDAR